MLYECTIAYRITGYGVVEVEADSPEEAKELALEEYERGNSDHQRLDWDSADDPEVVDIVEIN